MNQFVPYKWKEKRALNIGWGNAGWGIAGGAMSALTGEGSTGRRIFRGATSAMGSAVGSALGSVVPVVGTLIGGAIGGMLGDAVGNIGMKKKKEPTSSGAIAVPPNTPPLQPAGGQVGAIPKVAFYLGKEAGVESLLMAGPKLMTKGMGAAAKSITKSIPKAIGNAARNPVSFGKKFAVGLGATAIGGPMYMRHLYEKKGIQ